jgi:hypothetical protein
MFQIVSGEVEFTTPRPFESKSARVKLSFTVDPGVDPELATAHVADIARRRAEGIVAQDHVVQAATPVPPMVQRRRAATANAPSPVVPTPASAPPATPAADPFGSTTAPSAPNAPTAEPASTAVAAVVLSDDAMRDACARKVNGADPTQRPAVTAKVRDLIAKFCGGDPKSAIGVPIEQRQAFLAELAAVSLGGTK